MMTTDPLDDVFRALAHADRRRVLDILREQPGANVKSICRHFDVSRVAVLKQLTVLERANLVISEREGRERRLYLNPVPIQMIHERWTDEFSSLWAGRVTDLKRRAERA